jgi:hypothetical protein
MGDAAVSSTALPASYQLTKVARRAARELLDFYRSGIRGCSVEEDPNNACTWHAILQVLPGTSHDGEILRLSVHFSQDCPFKSPQFDFEGGVPIPVSFSEVLRKRWCAAHSATHFFPQLATTTAVGCSVRNKLESMIFFGVVAYYTHFDYTVGASLMQVFPAQHHITPCSSLSCPSPRAACRRIHLQTLQVRSMLTRTR